MTRQPILLIWAITLILLSTLVSKVSQTDDFESQLHQSESHSHHSESHFHHSDSQLHHSSRVKRLIGGNSITDGQWPWLVNLRGHIPSSWTWIFVTGYQDIYCGGTLIDKQWVMSAAHCFNVPGAPSGIKIASNWYVKAGTVDSNSGVNSIWSLSSSTTPQSLSFWTVQGSKIFVHPEYNAQNSWANDIVLLKLDTPLPLQPTNPYINTVALPISVRDYWPPPGVNCYMQGWGCTALNGPVQEYASSALLPTISHYDCTYYGDIGFDRICAGYRLDDTGICKGDSGGPLVCLHNNTWTVAGIASYTSADDPGNYPGIFTKVSKYTNWITTTMANN